MHCYGLSHLRSCKPFAAVTIIFIIYSYLGYLTYRQLISGPNRDPNSALPVPPRALSRHLNLPVLGHTILFHRFGGDIAYLFKSDWREWRWLPWTRRLGEVYCFFAWGKWNVAIKGSERVRKVIEESDLTDSWAYNQPPEQILGKSCPVFLEGEEETRFKLMFAEPLSYSSLVRHAPQFASLAEKCLAKITTGKYDTGEKVPQVGTAEINSQYDAFSKTNSDGPSEKDTILKPEVSTEENLEDCGDQIKPEDLRLYALDLVSGPILQLKPEWQDPDETVPRQKDLKNSTLVDEENLTREGKVENESFEKDTPNDEMLLLWMNRLRYGLCDLRLDWGPSWLQLWRITWYGRAQNAREHLEEFMLDHVADLVGDSHPDDPAVFAAEDRWVSTFPMWRLTARYFFGNHSVGISSAYSNGEYEQSITQPSNDDNWKKKHPKIETLQTQSKLVGSDGMTSRPSLPQEGRVPSVIESILDVKDSEGCAINKVAATDLSLILWMMLDVGQAWTSMALHLLSKHEDACIEIQNEIDLLEEQYQDQLYTPFVLGKMEKLNNLIHEAMRFCPAFMGGMKTVSKTVEMDGVQVPKGASVCLSQCNEEDSFTINYKTPKKPEEMGALYPSFELYGFLPLQGLEVPMMVLQTKIFLIVILRKCTPGQPTKETSLIRRVTGRICKSFQPNCSPAVGNLSPLSKSQAEVETDLERVEGCSPHSCNSPEISTTRSFSQRRRESGITIKKVPFTRVPFPKPLKAISIRPRRAIRMAADEILSTNSGQNSV